MGLSMYPNPTTGLLNISKSQSGSAKIELTDLNGKILEKREIEEAIILDLTGYPKGLYLLHFQMNGVQITERIAVQ
jgi:hypothetical protein